MGLARLRIERPIRSPAYLFKRADQVPSSASSRSGIQPPRGSTLPPNIDRE